MGEEMGHFVRPSSVLPQFVFCLKLVSLPLLKKRRLRYSDGTQKDPAPPHFEYEQNGIVAMAMMTMNPVHAVAASGGYVRSAAELDLEYYLRDLFGNQNERVGNILPSAPPPMKPPRIITNPLLHILLNDQFSYLRGYKDGLCWSQERERP